MLSLGLGLQTRSGRPGPGIPTAGLFTVLPIPPQGWEVGTAVGLDLRAFFLYSAGSLAFAVTPALPAGLDLAGGVLSGIPLAPLPATAFTVTATAVGGSRDGETRQSVLQAEVHPGNTAPVGGGASLVFAVMPHQPPANLAPLGADSSLTFVVPAGLPTDTVAPTISGSVPADGATGVAVGTDIAITFSEPVAFGSGVIALRSGGVDVEVFDVSLDVGTGAGQVSISGSTLTIRPTADLAASTGYAIRIAATAITDTSAAANAFAGIADDTTLNFTTAAATVTRRALYSASAAANTAMRSAADVTLPSSGYTVSFWVKTAGNQSGNTMFASETGADQIWLNGSRGLIGRYGNSADGSASSPPVISDNTWTHVNCQLGLNISGSNDVVLQMNGGSAYTRDNTASASESAAGCILYLLGDDAAGGASDDGFAGRIFDFCIASGLHAPSAMNYDAGAWKDLDATPLAALILRLDGRNAGDPGEDGSGNGHTFIIESGGVTLDDGDLPSGANP